LPQEAHEEELHVPHEDPLPATAPSPLTLAKKREMARRGLAAPHLGQAIGLSASLIARRASNRVWQSWQIYS
jgi:hypothetical protein